MKNLELRRTVLRAVTVGGGGALLVSTYVLLATGDGQRTLAFGIAFGCVCILATFLALLVTANNSQ
jgi:hypothetical protein